MDAWIASPHCVVCLSRSLYYVLIRCKCPSKSMNRHLHWLQSKLCLHRINVEISTLLAVVSQCIARTIEYVCTNWNVPEWPLGSRCVLLLMPLSASRSRMRVKLQLLSVYRRRNAREWIVNVVLGCCVTGQFIRPYAWQISLLGSLRSHRQYADDCTTPWIMNSQEIMNSAMRATSFHRQFMLRTSNGVQLHSN